MTPRGPVLVALAFAVLAVLAGPAAAADAHLDAPELKRTRGMLAIAARGSLGGPASAPLVARLRRDGATALEVALAPDASGAFTIDLLTPRLLLPDHYVLEVGPKGGAALVTRAFQSGSADEIAAGHARLDAWYRGAYTTLRELAVALERRGHFHRALLTQNAPHLERFDDAIDAWTVTLRGARMDLAVWERRLLLPRRPEVGAALLALIRVLEARAARWHDVLVTKGTPPPDAELQAAAATLVSALGLEPDALAAWTPGPLVTPQPARPDDLAGTAVLDGLTFESGFAQYVDRVGGYRLDLPEGLTAKPVDQRPNQRLLLSGDNDTFRLVVQVQTVPDLRDPLALAARVETFAWENYLSYKRLSTQRLVDADGVVTGVRIELEAEVDKAKDDRTKYVRLTHVSRWPTTGRRIEQLELVRPLDREAPAWFERAATSFDSLEDGP